VRIRYLRRGRANLMDQEIDAAAIFDHVLCHMRVTGDEDRNARCSPLGIRRQV
jgi:hypothetical protein